MPVVPLALRGLWGSLFSRSGGRAFFKWPRGPFSRIELVAGPALAPETVSPESAAGDGGRAAGGLEVE